MPDSQAEARPPGGGSLTPDQEKRFERRIKIWELIFKGLLPVSIGVLTWYVGYIADLSRRATEEVRFREAERSRQLTSKIEFSARQKDLDVNLGMQMFKTLLSDYLTREEGKEKEEQVRKKLLLLRLIALNFQDVPINLKPLFEDLDRRLTNPRDRAELHDIALEVARRQAYRLTLQGLDLKDIILKKEGDTVVITGSEKVKEQLENLPFTLAVHELNQDNFKATLTYEGRTFGPFTVSRFDMPVVDNVKVGDFRVSLLMLSLNGGTAAARLVVFPSDLAADRFDLKELSMGQRFKVLSE
uniref:Uncharacterized protein n=1 Tax=Desulfobacca acetoxidans TaxID=60893 RepID=A0A7V4G852_9BACT